MIRRPSKYHDIEVRPNRFLPPKGYFAITFFGKILIRKENAKNWEQSSDSQSGKIMKHHEWIHVQQAVSTHDSWICFYLRYIYYFLKDKPLRHGGQTAYHANPFEMEAYIYESDLSYARNNPNGANGWRFFAAMTLPQRLEILYKHNIFFPTKQRQSAKND